MRLLFISLFASAAALGGPGRPTALTVEGLRKPTVLTKADRDFLDCLISEFLFDPKGAVRVRIPASAIRPRRPFDSPGDTREGWLVRGRGGEPDRVYFADGESTPAPPPDRMHQVSFVTACRRLYQLGAQSSNDNLLAQLAYTRWGGQEDSELTLAAWLHRLGHDDLAARALASARNGNRDDPRVRLRRNLADRAAEAMYDGFCQRADSEALAHGERLFRLYPDLAANRHQHAEQIFNDLRRRQSAGKLNPKRSTELPKGFADWDMPKKLAFLIESLDEMDTDETMVFISRRTVEDHRVAALVDCGEAAIPLLLEALDHDTRLTRIPEVQYGGCLMNRTRQVYSARDKLESLIQSILRVTEFDPMSPGPDPREPKARAAWIRRYWETYGSMPFNERMMKIVADPDAYAFARREAAANLARPQRDCSCRWDRSTDGDFRPVRRQNPNITRFHSPTAAKAILAAWEHELRERNRRPGEFRGNW